MGFKTRGDGGDDVVYSLFYIFTILGALTTAYLLYFIHPHEEVSDYKYLELNKLLVDSDILAAGDLLLKGMVDDAFEDDVVSNREYKGLISYIEKIESADGADKARKEPE